MMFGKWIVSQLCSLLIMASPAPDELVRRSLVTRYVDAVNRYDEVLWAGTWAVNGVWDLAGMAVEG